MFSKEHHVNMTSNIGTHWAHIVVPKSAQMAHI